MIVDLLNAQIENAANAAIGDVLYIDPNAWIMGQAGSPFVGHELCTIDPYFTDINLAHEERSYHPNSLGHQAFTQILREYLN